MHKDLGHNFIDCVAETYQSIVVYGFKSELFGNKGNQSRIEVFGNFLVLKICFISNLIDSPTTIQNLQKNPACKPSDPGALNTFMDFKAKNISAFVGVAAKF